MHNPRMPGRRQRQEDATRAMPTVPGDIFPRQPKEQTLHLRMSGEGRVTVRQKGGKVFFLHLLGRFQKLAENVPQSIQLKTWLIAHAVSVLGTCWPRFLICSRSVFVN